jgi:GR25 family glycosyltransferase involved in LPS biosynthesis
MIDAYIITLLNHEKYRNFSNEVLKSCDEHKMNGILWEAFDGISDKEKIIVPKNLQNQIHISLLKVKNLTLTLPEIATFYSHYSLWCHCVQINKPIVILEHDVKIIKKYTQHQYKNSIVYLGHELQLENNKIEPIVTIEGYNYSFIRGAYGYSVDPEICKNLVSHTIKEGICRPVDVTIRSDYFSIIQNDVYLIHIGKESTMPNRQLFKEINEILNTQIKYT